MTWQIFRQACLLVAGLITATFVSPVTAQEKLAVPPKARQKEVKQQLRSEKKIPKRDGSNDQNVLNAFALIDLAATEPRITAQATPFGPKRSIVPISPNFQNWRPNQKAGFTKIRL